jgi:hypothetical protein
VATTSGDVRDRMIQSIEQLFRLVNRLPTITAPGSSD